MTHQGYQLKTVGQVVSDQRVTADGGNERTVVIEMLSPLEIASQEVWPSLEDEIDIYENREGKYHGVGG